jgi:uncharacterized protein (TIGR03437 family)
MQTGVLSLAASSATAISITAMILATATLAAGQPNSGRITMRTIPFPTAVVDVAGNLYFTGSVAPGELTPTEGAAQSTPGGGTCLTSAFPVVPRPCRDAFLEKMDGNGNVVFATLLDGSTDDTGGQIAFDSEGNIFVSGLTDGSFPATPGGASQSTAKGIFVTKFSGDGKRILYSVVLPAQSGLVFAVDRNGYAYVGGTTPANHAFAAKLSPDGSSLLYNTTIAGSGTEETFGLAAGGSGNVVVSGVTTSSDLPVTPGAFQTRKAGPQSAFVAKLNADGEIVFCSYLGGSRWDTGGQVQVDAEGNIYLVGRATSLDFPTTPGTFQPAPVIPPWASAPGSFVAKLSADGGSLLYSTYFMTDGSVAELALGAAGDVYVSATSAAGFPVTVNAPQPCLGGSHDIVIAHLDRGGALIEATYFGGTGDDVPYSLSLTGNGTLRLTGGITSSPVFRYVVAEIAFGGTDWIAPACLSPDVLHSATFSLGDVSPGAFFSLTGFGIGPETAAIYRSGDRTFSLGDVQVFFDGKPAALTYAQSRQINGIAPVELTGTVANIVVQYGGVPIGPVSAPVSFAAPELFRLNPGNSTQAAALNEDGTVNGPANPAARGSIVSLYGTGFGLSEPACADGVRNAGVARLQSNEVVSSSWFSAPDPTGIEYIGAAVGLLCGVQQINFRIPTFIESGIVPIGFVAQTTPGSHFAQTSGGVTIAVK